MRRPSRSRLGIATTLVAVALVATACFTANLSGSGSTGSAIQPNRKLEFNLRSNDSLGFGFGGATGRLKDSGKNPLFRHGVNISFNNGLVLGIGSDCTGGEFILSGTPRPVHAVRGAVTGPSGPVDLCDRYSDPRAWFGVVTYSSADPRRYPNQGFANCNEYYQYYVEMIFGSIFYGIGRPTPRRSTSGENISGFGIAVIIDTNYNRNYDKGDRVGFVPVCGPYTHIPIPATATVARTADFSSVKVPAVLQAALDRMAKRPAPVRRADPVSGYNYLTCGYNSPLFQDPNYLGTGDTIPFFGDSGIFGGAIVPGAVASELVDDNPMVPILLALLCAGKVSGGDLKIGIATRMTATTSTSSTTSPPTVAPQD